MVDRYTKVVLTVIALALTVIAVRDVVGPVSAQLDEPCGRIDRPCYIVADRPVKVTNDGHPLYVMQR
jgi:hypothetical protein